ncbi:MAG: GGDEF domain-containing protein [Deltaproteobacteria bacterium]|nr:GGDEF domain-containing protein [Deltaproteobacteria bacterium]
MSEEVRAVKEIISLDKELPLDQIDQGIRRIKDLIIEKERGTVSENREFDPLHKLEKQVFEACRIIRRIMAALLEGFYPMTSEMEATAENIQIDCIGDIAQIEFKKPTDDFLVFLDEIKIKISQDFRYINKTFLSLLEQVKELEKTITNEFGGSDTLKEIEYFEMKINSEVGSIADSFNMYTTIDEIKHVVVAKLKHIKSLVSLKKNDDMKKVDNARKNIKKLKKRISKVESNALKISKKAKLFQKAATRDGLTGLYNRKAFDRRVEDALQVFNENGEPFSIVLFDVDKFKEINDTLGHVAGDKVLQKVSQCLEETFRKDDFIARYGGDEFVVVIAGLTGEKAQEKISVFNDNLKKRRFVSYKEGEVDITVSAGLALPVDGDVSETLIERADKAMYEIKQKNA